MHAILSDRNGEVAAFGVYITSAFRWAIGGHGSDAFRLASKASIRAWYSSVTSMSSMPRIKWSFAQRADVERIPCAVRPNDNLAGKVDGHLRAQPRLQVFPDSRPASRKMRSSPSFSACRFTARAGRHHARHRHLAATLHAGSFAQVLDAALVQEPIKTIDG